MRRLPLRVKITAAAVLMAILVAVVFMAPWAKAPKNAETSSATVTPKAAVASLGQILSIADKCLDNQHGRKKNGNPIQLYACNKSQAQNWEIVNDTIVNGNGYCLDVREASTKEYSYVQLWECNGIATQKWVVKDGWNLVNTSTGFCLTDKDSGKDNGNPFWVKKCEGSAAQTFKFKLAVSKTTPGSGAIVSSGVVSSEPAPAAGSAVGDGSSSGTGSSSGGSSSGSSGGSAGGGGGSGSTDTGGHQQTGPGITLVQNLSGSTFSKTVNSAGTSATVSLEPKTYTFSNFADGTQTISQGAFAYGADIKVKTLLGAGIGHTILQMNANTSNKAGDVPPNCAGGGTSCPTNNLYLVRMSLPSSKVDGLTIQGTSQGHLYNGLRFETVSNPTLTNSSINGIPGDGSSNPGETFAVNFQRASGTATVTNVSVDGQNIASAGIAPNSCSATFNITNYTASNLKYSAGIALWQQTGTVNLWNYTSTNNARALGAERLGATVNIYDPSWDAPNIGHDITYTPYNGYSSRINFYFSSASKLPGRKIVILTNTTTVKSTVHVYINNVEQTQSNYIAWQGV